MLGYLKKLHNDRGALGILMLFCLWGLILLLALIFNTTEVTNRRQQTQTAADAAAQSAALWMARTTNQAAATNMMICQNASAEVVWRSVAATSTDIRNRLNQELVAVGNIGPNDPARIALQNFPDQVDQDYQIAVAALNAVNATMAKTKLTADQNKTLKNQTRQALQVLNWMQNTWVDGQPGINPYQPQPPSDSGASGLRQLVNLWVNIDVERNKNLIRRYIQDELAILDQFDAKTSPAGPATDAALAPLRQARAEIFSNYQQTILQQTPVVIEDQRSQLAAFHDRDITLADPARGSAAQQPAQIQAPVMAANDPAMPPTITHTDSIREHYPAQAIATFGAAYNPVQIDPLNVHTGDARIWHPGVDIALPDDFVARYPGTPNFIHINGNNPDGYGWGHVYAAPLEQYFFNRVARDSNGGITSLGKDYIQKIDALRARMASPNTPINDRLLVPNLTPNLPNSLQDLQVDPDNPPTHPRLNIPVNIDTAGFNGQLFIDIVAYNAAASTYATLLDTGLRNLENAYYNEFYRFSWPFAEAIWQHHIHASEMAVVEALGAARQFVVLKTYQLRNLPDWAIPGMQTSAAQRVYESLFNNQRDAVIQRLANSVHRRNPGANFGDIANHAIAALQEGATVISMEVAAEWVSRPWPYEITPSENDLGRHQGLLAKDRIGYFSLLTGAQTRHPLHVAFPTLFAKPRDGMPLLAYAQAEIFNGNEFNGAWGGNEKYDQVSAIATGSPAMWRLCSTGGWSWQPRLSNADALLPAWNLNPEFADYFHNAGLTPPDAGSLREINMH